MNIYYSNIIKLFKNPVYLISLITIFFNSQSFSQIKEENLLLNWGSWLVLQAIPSPNWYEDKNESKSQYRFGLEWQIIPVNYSFSSNKYVSSFNFFKIKPVNRFSGSAELFFQPSLITGSFRNNDLKKFNWKSGIRFIFPISHNGEYLALSGGFGIYAQNSYFKKYFGITYEASIYSFFGMAGLKFNYNQNAPSKFNFGLYIKYY